MITILWTAVLLYVMPLIVELPEWCNDMLMFCALILYFVALIMWNNFTSKVEELEKKVKELTEDKEEK